MAQVVVVGRLFSSCVDFNQVLILRLFAVQHIVEVGDPGGEQRGIDLLQLVQVALGLGEHAQNVIDGDKAAFFPQLEQLLDGRILFLDLNSFVWKGFHGRQAGARFAALRSSISAQCGLLLLSLGFSPVTMYSESASEST